MSAAFVAMLPMIYLSGLIFPIENMPPAIQLVTCAIPLRYYAEILRGFFLRGSGLDVLWPEALVLLDGHRDPDRRLAPVPEEAGLARPARSAGRYKPVTSPPASPLGRPRPRASTSPLRPRTPRPTPGPPGPGAENTSSAGSSSDWSR